MATFIVPTVPDVQTEVGLRPENVNPLFTVSDYEDAVAARLAVEAAYVRVRTGNGALTGDNAMMARTVTLWRTAASIYHMAGQLNEKYKAEAMDYERRAAEMLDTLTGSISGAIDGSGSGNGAATLSTARYRIEANGALVANG